MPKVTQPPYTPVRASSSVKGYVARGTRYSVASTRPTRAAAGMAYTASRGGGDLDDVTRRLSIWGTLDDIARSHGARVTVVRVPCPCCGQRRPVPRVNAAGRRWLQAKMGDLYARRRARIAPAA